VIRQVLEAHFFDLELPDPGGDDAETVAREALRIVRHTRRSTADC